MTYKLDPPISVQGLNLRMINRFEGASRVHGQTVFMTGQKTPVAVVVQGAGPTKIFALDGEVFDDEHLKCICRDIPNIGKLF
jgi:hypothetical protein